MLAECEQQRRTKEQPGQNAEKSLGRRMDEKKRSCQTADYTRNHKRDHDAPRDVQFLRVSAAARRRANPERQRVGRIRRHWRHSRKQKGRKGNETPAPCDGIDPSPEDPGKEKEYRVVKVQA